MSSSLSGNTIDTDLRVPRSGGGAGESGGSASTMTSVGGDGGVGGVCLKVLTAAGGVGAGDAVGVGDRLRGKLATSRPAESDRMEPKVWSGEASAAAAPAMPRAPATPRAPAEPRHAHRDRAEPAGATTKRSGDGGPAAALSELLRLLLTALMGHRGAADTDAGCDEQDSG